jgi:hypothetical protein
LFPLAAKDDQVGDFITVDVESEETGESDTEATTSQSPEIELELPFGIVLRIRGIAPQ